MIRSAVSVEAETEEEFVDESLAPRLRRGDVYPTPVLIGRARRRIRAGGDVTIDRLAPEMRQLRRSFDAASSLVGFCGFRGKCSKLPNDLVRAVCNRISQFDEGSVLPRVQLHKFERLLFSERKRTGVCSRMPHTTPSKRIETPVQRYRKTPDGPLPAPRIGLGTIRSERPRFDARLERPASP